MMEAFTDPNKDYQFSDPTARANANPGSGRGHSIKLEYLGSGKQQLAGGIPQNGPYNGLSEFELDCLYIDRQQLLGARLPSFASILREVLLRQDEELRVSIHGYVPLITTEQVKEFSGRYGNFAGNKRLKTIGADAVVDGLYERDSHRRMHAPTTAYGGAREDLAKLYSPRKEILGIRLPFRRPHRKEDIREALAAQDRQLRALVAGYQPLLTVEDVNNFKAKYTLSGMAKSSHDTSGGTSSQRPENEMPQKKKRASDVEGSIQNHSIVRNANLQLARPLLSYSISSSKQKQRVRKTVNLQGAPSTVQKLLKGPSSALQSDAYLQMQQMALQKATKFDCQDVPFDKPDSRVGMDFAALEAHRSWYYGLDPSATNDSTARVFDQGPYWEF